MSCPDCVLLLLLLMMMMMMMMMMMFIPSHSVSFRTAKSSS
jgi:hypothetical protein